jgi:hypothetical protein
LEQITTCSRIFNLRAGWGHSSTRFPVGIACRAKFFHGFPSSSSVENALALELSPNGYVFEHVRLLPFDQSLEPVLSYDTGLITTLKEKYECCVTSRLKTQV